MAATRQRRMRVRSKVAKQRKRVLADVKAAAKRSEQLAISKPDQPATAQDARALATTLGAMAKVLQASSTGDTAIKAAARGVEALGRSYDLLARSREEQDLAKAYDLLRRSVAATETAQAERRRARDAWPL